jgi:2-polyprenyl-3-methyl-5-hydroxy-6-metoxy-1,4-benzoquinol methylase
VTRPTCNICDSAVSSILVSKDGCDIYQCAECGLAFTHPQPVSLDEQYDSAYFDLYRKRHAFRLKRGDARLRRIELLRKPGTLLDIGCSLGYFVEAANARGWNASGIEISPHAAQEARKIGLDVRTGVLEDAGYSSRAFDCVTMWDVLEHVPDPTAHMLEVRRVLSKDGLVVVGTPNLGHIMFRIKRERWRHLKPREHIFYFRKSSITRLLAKTGFDVVKPRMPSVRFNDVMIVYGVPNGLEIPSN